MLVPNGAMRVFVQICKLVDQGKTPTLRQVAKIMNVAHNNVWQHIRTLEKHGLITREKKKSRTIRPAFRLEMYVADQQNATVAQGSGV